MNIKIRQRVVVTLAVVAALAGGCRNSNDQYNRFAQALTGYTNALDQLLKVSGPIAIEATSEQLIQMDTDDAQDFTIYQGVSQTNTKRLELLGHLRSHTRLLGQYFALITELATSNTPNTTAEATKNIVSGLEAVSKQLISSDKFPQQTFTDAQENIPALVNVAVSSKINDAIREELELRKEMIQNQLLLQEVLLNVIIDDVKSDINDIHVVREERIIATPYGTTKIPAKDQQDWIDQRGKIMILQSKIVELEEARKVSGEFRSVFEDFVSGRLNYRSLERITAQMNEIAEVAETVSTK